MSVAPTSSIPLSGQDHIDALLSDTKWGGGQGTAVSLTYSFPWAFGANATFSGYRNEAYSLLGEHQATYRYGLDEEAQQVFREALAQWSSVANVTFTEVSDSAADYGTLRVAWTSADLEAWGWSYLPNAYYPSGGDIWISTQTDTAELSWALGKYDWASMIHEIGHALGFKHPFEDGVVLDAPYDSNLYTIMSYTDPPKNVYPSAGVVNGTYDWVWYYVYPETPMLYDIAAIQYLYGANTGYRTGNDVYTFEPDRPFFKTIWDAGGTDEISVSNFTLGCDIDLREGAFSSIRIAPPSDLGGAKLTYDGSNNLAIAFDCEIENALGGAGDDRFTGNALNNRLNGGLGTDTAVFSGRLFDYTITHVAGMTFTLADKRNQDGRDTVIDIERWEFSDQVVQASSYVSEIPAYQIAEVLSQQGATYDLYKLANGSISISISGGNVGDEADPGAIELTKSNGKPYVPKLANMTVLDQGDGGFTVIGQKGTRWIELDVAPTGIVAAGQQKITIADVLAYESRYAIDLNDDDFIGDVIARIFDGDGHVANDSLGLYQSALGVIYLDTANAQTGSAVSAQAQALVLASGRFFALKAGQSILGLAERSDGQLELIYTKGTRFIAQPFDEESGLLEGGAKKLSEAQVLAREYYYDLDLNSDGDISLTGQASPPSDWALI